MLLQCILGQVQARSEFYYREHKTQTSIVIISLWELSDSPTIGIGLHAWHFGRDWTACM